MSGNVVAARAEFEKALAINQGNLQAIGGLAGLDLRAKNPAAARARIEARVAADPKNVALRMLAGRVYRAMGDATAAESAFRAALDIDPNQLEAYGALGGIYASQKKLDEARAEFEKLAKVRPEAAVGSYTLVGILYQFQNRNAEARAAYEKVIAIDSRAAVAANNLAWIYAEEGGNLDVALQLAQTAKGQIPDRHEVNDTLGWVYYKRGLATLAVPPLREAVEADPKNAGYRFHLGLAHAKAGNAARAREELQQGLALDPKNPLAEEANKTLATLAK